MRNIHLVKKYESKKAICNCKSLAKSVFCAGDDKNIIFACTDVDKKCPKLLSLSWHHDQDSSGEIVPEVLCEDPILQGVTHMEYNSNSMKLYLATKNSSFIQFNLIDELDELFQSEAGISTFSVAPDSRLVVIVTDDDKMLLLTLSHLESLSQVPLNSDSDSEKASLRPVNVCWRHDSKYFAINYFDTSPGMARRRIKVFDEFGSLFSTTDESSFIDDAQAILNWQPTGGLIATLGLKDSKELCISLFEINGLKRADFDPAKCNSNIGPGGDTHDIQGILWNKTADILALKKEYSVELWYRDNYAWMCKHVIENEVKQKNGDFEREPIIFCTWDSDLNFRLHVVYKSGNYTSVDLSLEYSSGSSNGSGISASISGNTVYFTPYRDRCAPPPYGYSKILLEHQVQEIIVSSFWDGILCVLKKEIIFFKNNNSNLENLKTFKIPEVAKGAYNWIYPEMNTLCCIKNGQVVVLSLPSLEEKGPKDMELAEKGTYSDNCTKICPLHRSMSETDFILAKQNNGTINQINIKTGSITFKAKLSPRINFNLKYLIFDTTIETLSSSLIILAYDLTSKQLVASLDKSSKKLSSDCLSFGTFEDKLLFTTVQGTLEIYGVEQIKAFIEKSSVNLKPDNVYTRKVEKGSHIVSIVINQMKEPQLNMQILPRGNMETICPRPLIIALINSELRNSPDFNSILEAMRRHRIDYNILVDELKFIEKEEQGSQLEESFESIVSQLKNREIIINLITEMNEKNIDAVKIFEKVLKKLVDSGDSNLFAMPYLAAMSKLGLYEDVLQSKLISSEMENREIVKKRIKFLSFYCDNPEILFESALGTYDLALTAIVSDCLNKDPKEYLPVLNEMKTLSIEKRQFTIDNKLKRYDKAIKSLILDGETTVKEVLKYVEKHRLYPEALKFLSSESESEPRNERIIELIKEVNLGRGKYLEDNRKYKEASIFYIKGENWEKAIELCTKSGCWETALSIANKQNTEPEKLQMLCKKIFLALEEREEFDSCAQICEIYLQDPEKALEFWVKAHKWTRGQALCFRHPEHMTQIDQYLRPKLLEHLTKVQESLESSSSEVKKYSERLKIVREEREKAIQNGINGDHGENGNFSDSESVSSFRSSSNTSSSVYTGKTYNSGKNRRKAERKLFSLKEGSKHEDIGIAVFLWEIFTRIHSESKKEVESTVESLWRFDLEEEASELTESFDNLLVFCDSSIKFVWSALLPEIPNLDNKYRLQPIGWSTTWDKLIFTFKSSAGKT